MKPIYEPKGNGGKGMKRIIASRGTGKSTELLRMALEDKNAAIAVPSRTSVNYYCVLAHEALGVPIEKINKFQGMAQIQDVIVAPFFDFTVNPEVRKFTSRAVYIDEIEECIKMMMPFDDLAGYTLSIE